MKSCVLQPYRMLPLLSEQCRQLGKRREMDEWIRALFSFHVYFIFFAVSVILFACTCTWRCNAWKYHICVSAFKWLWLHALLLIFECGLYVVESHRDFFYSFWIFSAALRCDFWKHSPDFVSVREYMRRVHFSVPMFLFIAVDANGPTSETKFLFRLFIVSDPLTQISYVVCHREAWWSKK